MTRPDEIAALEEVKASLARNITLMSHHQAILLRLVDDRLAAASPGAEVREACAKIADEKAKVWHEWNNSSQAFAAEHIALSIRNLDLTALVHPSVSGWIADEFDCGDYEFSPTHWRPLDLSTPTPPSGDDVAWLIAEIESKKIHYPADPEKLARFNRIKASIQSAAHGGATKSDGGVEIPFGAMNDDPSAPGFKPGPSDPAQEQEAVAWLQSQNGVSIVSKHRLDPRAFEYGWTEEPLFRARPVSLEREAIEQIIDPTAQGDYRRSERQHKADAILAMIEGRT